MKNIIILGSGRSGTSMLAGSFSDSGYFMGNELWPANDSNPKGFFEDRIINEINEDILELVAPKRPVIFGQHLFRERPIKWQRWLLNLDTDKKIKTNKEINDRINIALNIEPFCFKDPRFSYTLPIWKPYLKNTVYLCIFRNPAHTSQSILKECNNSPVLNHRKKGIKISYNHAINIWTSMYSHILKNHCKEENWMFLHYEQIFQKETQQRLEQISGAKLNSSFPEKKLQSKQDFDYIPEKCKKVYEELCELSGFKE